MSFTVKVSRNIDNVKGLPNRVIASLKRELSEGMFDFARIVQKNLRFQVSSKNLIWQGTLWAGIQARRKNRSTSVVVMPIEGVYVDSMKPHFVKLKRGRAIRQWAMDKGNERIQKVAEREGSIFVKPHPFINHTFELSRTKLDQIIMTRATKAMTEVI